MNVRLRSALLIEKGCMDPVKQVKGMDVGQEAQERVYWQATGNGPRSLFRYFFSLGKEALLLLKYYYALFARNGLIPRNGLWSDRPFRCLVIF
jgi:hypothetical protein